MNVELDSQALRMVLVSRWRGDGTAGEGRLAFPGWNKPTGRGAAPEAVTREPAVTQSGGPAVRPAVRVRTLSDVLGWLRYAVRASRAAGASP